MLKSTIIGTQELVLTLVSCLRSQGFEYVAAHFLRMTNGSFFVVRVWPTGTRTYVHDMNVERLQHLMDNDDQDRANVAFVAFPDQPELATSFRQFFVGKGLRVFTWPQDLVANTEDKAAYMVFNASQALAAEQG